MLTLVGQTKLRATLDSYTIETVPRSLMFLGAEGCGKRAFAAYLANNLKLELINISNAYSDEDLLEYSMCPIPKMYLIDLRYINEKDQNKLLKFIEEPAETCFIIVVANSEIGIINTILNRCIKLHFAQYTFEELKEIASFFHPNFNELDYQICKTPGQLVDLDDVATPKLKALCERIVQLKQPVDFGHMLDIFTKINCYENYDQFGFDAFFNMLAYVSSNDFIETESEHSYTIYKLTVNYLRKFAIAPKVNRHDFIISFLSKLYEVI